MGWDAYAKTKRLYPFKLAAKRVLKVADSVDGGLDHGWLDCSACAIALEEATGLNAWDEDGWDEKMVKRLAANAKWPEMVDKDNAWAVYSAKHFLETCAKVRCGIDFSW